MFKSIISALFGPGMASIEATNVNARMQGSQPPLLIDVRQPGEYQTGHIAKAKSIPLDQLTTRMKELPRDREIICVCQSGMRSQSATSLLNREGYQAVNMRGGMLAWRRAGLPVRQGK